MSFDIYFNDSYFASKSSLKEAKEAAVVGNAGVGNKYSMTIVRPTPLSKWDYNGSTKKWTRRSR